MRWVAGSVVACHDWIGAGRLVEVSVDTDSDKPSLGSLTQQQQLLRQQARHGAAGAGLITPKVENVRPAVLEPATLVAPESWGVCTLSKPSTGGAARRQRTGGGGSTVLINIDQTPLVHRSVLCEKAIAAADLVPGARLLVEVLGGRRCVEHNQIDAV